MIPSQPSCASCWRNIFTAVLTSSCDKKWCHLDCSATFRNRWKSDGAKCKLYGGWSETVKTRPWTALSFPRPCEVSNCPVGGRQLLVRMNSPNTCLKFSLSSNVAHGVNGGASRLACLRHEHVQPDFKQSDAYTIIRTNNFHSPMKVNRQNVFGCHILAHCMLLIPNRQSCNAPLSRLLLKTPSAAEPWNAKQTCGKV
jgi:hypothetical protein